MNVELHADKRTGHRTAQAHAVSHVNRPGEQEGIEAASVEPKSAARDTGSHSGSSLGLCMLDLRQPEVTAAERKGSRSSRLDQVQTGALESVDDMTRGSPLAHPASIGFAGKKPSSLT